jgi:hypothetical protein
MATNYDNDLMNLVANSEEQLRKQKEIDILANNMKPVAGTSEGVFALQDLLANPMAPKEQRAAAAQALNPGIRASIGQYGELSFTNIPGADVTYDYPSNSRPRTDAGLKAQGGKTGVAIENFDQQFTAIQGMADPVEAMNTYASLQSSAAEYINSKEASVRNQLEQSLGVTSLRTELETSNALDKDHYNTYYGGVNQGPSQETLGLISVLNQKQAQVDAEVQKRLSRDPEIVGLQSKLKTLDSFVASKYRDLQDTKQTVGLDLIPPEQIEATALAMGADISSETTRLKIAEGLVSGNTVLNRAQQIGMAAPTELVNVAAFGDGVTSTQAKRVLGSKLGRPEMVEQLLHRVKNFDTEYADVVAARKEEFSISTLDNLSSPKAKEEAKAAIQARKVQYVLEVIQADRTTAFVSKVAEWQAPQNPALNEVPTIIGDLQSTGESFNLDTIINRMDWTGGDRSTKIKAMTEYINSQSGSLEGNNFFGAPMRFSNPAMTEQYVQSLVVSKARQTQFGRAAQSFLTPQRPL